MAPLTFAFLFVLSMVGYAVLGRDEGKLRRDLGLRTVKTELALLNMRNAEGYRKLSYPVRVPSGGGMTYDFCQTSIDCKGDRRCEVKDVDSQDDICEGEPECWCIPSKYIGCFRTEECETGEVCARGYVANNCKSESFADDVDQAPLQRGLTLDPCDTNVDCERSRLCEKVVDDNAVPCNGGSGCRCNWSGIQACSTHGECPFGEVCATGDSGKSYCLSASIVSNSTSLIPVAKNLTLDDCDTSKDCKKPRECKVLNSAKDLVYCFSRSGCFCVPEELEECDTSQECDIGEVCVRFDNGNTYCVSERYAQSQGAPPVDGNNPTQTPSATSQPSQPPAPSGSAGPTVSTTGAPTPPAQTGDPSQGSTSTPKPLGEQSSEDVVCIDAKALDGFAKGDLVYATHRQAKVLCDENGSCATPGHIVVFKGKGMMMKSYCALRACEERVMMVNSPRYRRRLLIPSSTAELLFTSFAARYETRGEEMVLTTLNRIGL